MKSSIGVMVGLGVLSPSLLFGLGVRVPEQDAFAAARGNAFVATANNPSAVYYNPAGITQLQGLNSKVGIYIISLESTYQSSATGGEITTDPEFHGIPQVYSVLSFEDSPLSVGFGTYSPYGLGLEWPDNSPFRNLAKRGQIIYVSANPVVAVRVHPALAIGVGPTINYSQAKLSRGIAVPGDSFSFRGENFGFGFNAGILWQPQAKHSFGASYRSATTLDYDGSARTRLLFPFNADVTEAAQAEFRFPQHVIGGWSFRPTTNWNFEVNVDWTDWDNLNSVTLEKASGNVGLRFDWRSSFMYELGVTRYFANGFQVSGGYIFSENSVPDSSFNPSVPDSDRHIFGIGVGQQYESLKLEATYQFAWGPQRTVSGSPSSPPPFNQSADGRYEFTSHAFSLSVGYTF